MLGIGFIITHFVAMQKPQQRKYHSSCNRSVHRGTAHGKQRVKVCKRKTPHLFLMRSFLSPYGDGTTIAITECPYSGFSPPYGDGTLFVLFTFTACEFSPPYGDGTMVNLDRFGGVTFSPPYGDGTTTPKYPVMDDAFPSPCGDKLKFMTQLKILNYAQAFPSPCGDKLKFTARQLS